MKENNIQIIILAAGHGKRMNNPGTPKPLIELHGKPFIVHLLDAIAYSGVCDRPVVVVSADSELIRQALGARCDYVIQSEQLGTGHAVACTKTALEGKASHIMVLYGDHPLVSAKTIRSLADAHLANKSVLTMATVVVPDFEDWRQSFSDFGRVIRNPDGQVSAIIEKRDATPEQLAVREVNPSYFCFQADWLWRHIDALANDNAQHEYYLTDLAGLAFREDRPMAIVNIEPREALGVNTAEQLATIARLPL